MPNTNLAEYLLSVERFFSIIRKGGFILSPKDTQTVKNYYAKNIPLKVVLNGISRGAQIAQRSGNLKPPHHLSYYSKYIAAQIRNYRKNELQEIQKPQTTKILEQLIAEYNFLATTHTENPLVHKLYKTLQAKLQNLLQNIKHDLPMPTLKHKLLQIEMESVKELIAEKIDATPAALPLVPDKFPDPNAVPDKIAAETLRHLREKFKITSISELF